MRDSGRPAFCTPLVICLLISLTTATATAAQDVNRRFLDDLLAKYQSTPGKFAFGLVGDQQYTSEQEVKFLDVLRSMDAQDLAFVAHDGDLKGSGPCSDDFYRKRRDTLDSSRHPLVYTPGDNDWTDCHTPANGSFSPLERLSALRRIFFADPTHTLGQRKLAVTSQTGYPGHGDYVENLVWTHGEVVFATFHAVGSNNNLGRTLEGDLEFEDRTAANLAWIRTAFALAREGDFRGVVLITQANLRLETALTEDPARPYAAVNALLEAETRAFEGFVVLVHGDTHYFRIDKPLPVVPIGPGAALGVPRLHNFTRVETFGPPDPHWIRVNVDPADSDLFDFHIELSPG